MECKLNYNFYKTRKTSENVEVPDIDGYKPGSDEYSLHSHVWKDFGKWIVAMEKDDEKVSDWGKEHKHICHVLKSIGFTIYFFELIGDYTEEQYKAFSHIRLILDRILVTNQIAIKKLKFLSGYSGAIFPKFFNEFPQKKISAWSEEIENEIEKWSNEKFEFKDLDRKKYWNQITGGKEKSRRDVKGCYAMLLSALNTLKPDLPQENIAIIDDLIMRCEHGYFLGFLLERTLDDYEKKQPKKAKSPEATRSKDYILNRLTSFRKGREKRVLFVTKKIFEFDDNAKTKLRRMFDLVKIR
jgi:hypothetical protein